MPSELEDLHIDEVSMVGIGANKGARTILLKQRPTKTEDGKNFPASDYAYVPDRNKTTTWKLRLTSTPGGEPDARIVGAAVAALGTKGFRGQRVKIPKEDIPAVLARVRAAWFKANPDKDKDDLPKVLKKGLSLSEEEVRIKGVNINDDERVSLVGKIAEYLGIRKADLDLDLDVEEIMDKDAKKLQKDLEELSEKFEKLEKEKATADAVNTAVEGISKAKSSEEVDAVLKEIEDEEVLKVVTERAAERKAAFEKSVGEAEVKKFRDRLPETLQKAFDEMDEEDQEKFMKSFNEPGEDPVAKALEAVTEANKVLADKVEKLEGNVDVATIEEELKGLDGIVKDVGETAKTIVGLRKHDAGAADAMLEEYKALAKQAEEKGNLFKVLGKDGEVSGDAQEKIDKAAKAYHDEHPDITIEQAVAKVLEDHPELYDEHLEELEDK